MSSSNKSKGASGCARNPKTLRKSITNREHLMSSASDCTFLVGPEKQEFKALKGVLALASSVFQTMFYGETSHPETSAILVPDVTPAAFQVLLYHAYNLQELATSKNWSSVEEALEILYVSHKYSLLKLEESAKDYLLKNIDADNVFAILQDKLAQNNAVLKDECLNFFAKNTVECLNSDRFLEIPSSLAKQLFNHEAMSISSELVLFQALEKYAAKNNLKRKVLEQLLICIHFLSMTAAEFEEIVHTELLNKEEKLAIFAHTVNPRSTYLIPPTINKKKSKRNALA